MDARGKVRTYYFIAYAVITLLLFHAEVGQLIALSWNDNRYTHLAVVPVVAAGLLYLNRGRILRDLRYGVIPGVVFGVMAILLHFARAWWPNALGQQDGLTVAGAALVCSWIGGFAFFYGTRCAREALFPLGVLLLAIPIPPPTVFVAESFLQKESAEVTYHIIQLTSTPVYRDGLVFSLPGLTIEVAEECSGIRSAISLLITALVVSPLFLRTTWTRACLIFLTVPIAILKNAVRIVILSMLGVYVSEDYLHGNLHHHGGPVFSILSLALLLAALWGLRKLDFPGEREGLPAAIQPSPDPQGERG
jgi:exosortase